MTEVEVVMRSVLSKTVVLAAMAVLAGVGCGSSDERRPARAPASRTAVSTTQTTSAALTVSSAEAQPGASTPSTNATMTPAATPRRVPATVETASAVVRLATARCDREAECRNVGTGREFGNRDECVNEIGHYVVAALPSEECPGGVDSDALSTCLRDVQAEPCGDGKGAVDRLSSCSRDHLCASPF
jgi:hypothetical protein